MKCQAPVPRNSEFCVSRINAEYEEAEGHKSTVVKFLFDNQTCERIN